MFTQPVPDYFQDESEDALRSRMQWLETEMGLGDSFFAKLLRTDQQTVARWKEQRIALARAELLGLREFWEMMMHILSFVNFDFQRARKLLEHVPSTSTQGLRAAPTPPWVGSSIKTYLETHGFSVVDQVTRWITSFRFGTPSLTPECEEPCPSTLD